MTITEQAPMSSKRRKLLIDTDTMTNQIEKRKDKSGVTRRGIKILLALLRIKGPATREMIAQINGYSVGGVSTSETNYLLRDDLITQEKIMVKSKGSARGRYEFELTDKGAALLDLMLTGNKTS
jgi:predicted transcriptional regulator